MHVLDIHNWFRLPDYTASGAVWLRVDVILQVYIGFSSFSWDVGTVVGVGEDLGLYMFTIRSGSCEFVGFSLDLIKWRLYTVPEHATGTSLDFNNIAMVV